MIVESLMTRDPVACRPESTLADAAALMWRRDCGVVPVTDEEERVVGMITDRDICMALATSGRQAAEARVGEVMAREVETCTPVDDVREALEVMRARQLRRLPVVNSLGKLVGILSVSDVVLHTRKGKGKKHVSCRRTLAALRDICRPHGSTGDDAATDEGEREKKKAGGVKGKSDGAKAKDDEAANMADEALKGGGAGVETSVAPVEDHFNESAPTPEVEKARRRVGSRKTTVSRKSTGKRETASRRKVAGAGESESVGDAATESAGVSATESAGVVEGAGDVTG